MDSTPKNTPCLCDETAALWAEGLLSPPQQEEADRHAQACPLCRALLAVYKAVAAGQAAQGHAPVPSSVIEKAKNLVGQHAAQCMINVLVRFSQRAIESLQTDARILASPWVKPQLAFRSAGQPADLIILEQSLGNTVCRLEVSRHRPGSHRLALLFSPASAVSPPPQLRVTLRRSHEELESYVTSDGRAVFEQVGAGTYRIDVEGPHKGYICVHLLQS